MGKKKLMSSTALFLASAMTLQSVDWTTLNVFADTTDNVDEKLAYFVDCGDWDPTTLSDGDLFGQYNRVTDQVYGEDAVTGKKWGIVDSVSDPLTNGSSAKAPKAAYTDWSWPNEWVTGDGIAKTESSRYTKNQNEKGIDRNLHYKFELPNGDYTIGVYCVDPWSCSSGVAVAAEGTTVISAANCGMEEKVKVTVEDGELNLDFTNENSCINIAYIKIYFGDTTTSSDEEYDTSISAYSAYDLNQVDVTDSYLTNAEDKDIEYLLSLDNDKLLAGFRENAGLDMKGATRYTNGTGSVENWEDSLIGGHTLGHYMSAVSQAIASLPETDSRRAQLVTKLNDIIAGLKECQEAIGTGFIFGATILDKNNIELQFDNVEANKTNIFTQAWVPWYTMHKILAGLVDTYEYTGNETALEVAESLGDWIYNRTSKWTAAVQTTVLNIEYGGMNDALYELYAVTGEEKYAVAAHKFDEESLFKVVDAGNANALNNKHANTTIPKFVGALKGYVTTYGKDIEGVDTSKYLTYVEEFFDMVVDNHIYVTGDMGEWEHFGADNVLDTERTNCNCETCCVYNMLKIAKSLYMITGDTKYLDYYENAFYNTILSSQNPETGMTMYFQPMATGYFKVFGTATGDFWCCTGSGMENFTKLGNAMYFYNDDMVVVNQYFSSVLTDSAKNLKLTQTADIPSSEEVSFTVETIDGAETAASKIAFRIPDWTSDIMVSVNGEKVTYEEKDGLAVVSGLKNKDVITLTLPMSLTVSNLPDAENVYAFKYGPIVLSAKLGTDNMEQTVTGVNVAIPSAKVISEDYVSSGTDTIYVTNGSVADFMANISDNLVKTEGKLEWTLENTDANLTFVPHYSQYTERYGIYFAYESDADAFNTAKYVRDKASARFEAALSDTVQPGYGQYENDTLHNMQVSGEGSVGDTSDGTTRYAKAGGAFTYTMKVTKDTDNALQATFRTEDNGKTIKISVGNTVVYEETLNYDGDEEEYTVRIPVSAEIIHEAAYQKNDFDVADVTIESAKADEDSARVCEFLYMTTAYSTDTSLDLTASSGNIEKSEDGKAFSITVGKEVTSLDLTSKLATDYGYIKVNGSVIKSENPYTVDLSKYNYVTLTYTVYAEDHETTAEYTVNIAKDVDLSSRTDVDSSLAYFVNCGDYDVDTLSDGDLFGVYNGVTDQAYGIDPITGKKWGIVDTISNPLTNGTSSNTEITNAAYTDHTWPYETDITVKDSSEKTATNRYTKNQYESGIDRNLHYAFELPNGEYTVELYFTDPWSCSKNPVISAEGEVLMENTVMNKAVTVTADVTDGELNLDITAPSSTLCINLCYIKIYNNSSVTDEILYGDVDGNGVITLTDSAFIRRYLAGWTVTLDVTAADVNGDGTITVLDSALIRRYLAGWKVTWKGPESK